MHSTTFESLDQLCSQLVLILDGAMGTMIQRFHLTEDDFRGEYFANWAVKLKAVSSLL